MAYWAGRSLLMFSYDHEHDEATLLQIVIRAVERMRILRSSRPAAGCGRLPNRSTGPRRYAVTFRGN